MTKSKWIAVRVSVVAAGVALLVLAGGVVANGMGFKVTAPVEASGGLAPGGGPISNSGTNYIGLPYRPKLSLVTARDLFNDINGNAIPAPAQLLNKHRKNDDGFEVYTFGGGTLPPNGWNLAAGEGYILKLGNAVNYKLLGLHLPSVTVEFKAADGGVTSKSGTNYYAPPYHGVARTAREMFLEIGGSIQLINQHRKSDDGFEVYTYGGGTLPPNGWDIVTGESYIVKIGSPSLSFKPLHF